MAEYIERSEALGKCGWYNTVNGKSICAVRKDELAAIPAADVVEVRHGRWVVIDDDYGWDSEIDDEFYYVIECECSECHKRVNADRPNYCPNCGARMDGE